MYLLLVFLHLVGVFGFLLAHGTSAGISFLVRPGVDKPRLETLLRASGATVPVMYGSVLLLGLTGFVIVATQGLWRAGWIWASTAVFVAVASAMYYLGTRPFVRLRQSLATDGDLTVAMAAVHPRLIAATGALALLLILWLMVYKPF